jgi:tetratricopeptide (TPR) repeat protein
MESPQSFDLTTHFADAYLQSALQGANMRLAANALETIREALQGNRPHMEVRYLLDFEIGRADLKCLVPVLVKLREQISKMLDEREVQRLRQLYERDPKQGWQAWLLAYTQVFSEWGWYTLLCRKIAQDALLWVPDDAPSAEDIRYYTDCVYYGRWPETYDWFLFLVQQDLPKEQHENMLAIAAEIQLYQFYQPTQARKLLEQIGNSSPSYRVDQVWGEYYLQTKQPEKARPYFERNISKKPYIGSCYINLGDYFAEIGDLSSAEEQYELAVENAPGFIDGYQSLAQFLTKVDWYSDRDTRLQAYLERMRLLSENPAVPYTNIGEVYRTLGDYEKALQYFKQALDLDSNFVNTHNSLGYLELEQAGRVKEVQERQMLIAQARQAFNELLKLAPRALSGYWGMMFVKTEEKDIDEALEWLSKTRECHAEWESYVDAAQGELLRMQGKLPEARDALLRSLEKEPINPNVLTSLRSLSDDYKPQNSEIALQLLGVWRQHAGEAEEYTYQNQVGNVWYYHEDYPRAIEHYRLAISKNPNSPVILSNLALALEEIKTPGERLEELDKALDALGKAIKLKPEESDYSRRHEKLKIERDFIAACGEAALRFEYVITPIRLAGETDMIIHLVNENRDALSETTLQQIATVRQRVHEKLGVQPPTVLVSYLPGMDNPPGKFVISLREQPVEEGIVDSGEDVMTKLMEHLERVVECNMAEFTKYQETYDLLAGCTAEACKALLASPRSVILFMQVLQELLQNVQPVKSIEQIASHVFKMSQTNQTPEQMATELRRSVLAESELHNGK